MRIIYFGMLGEFSCAPLAALLKVGLDVCGVILPGDQAAARAPIDRLVPRQPSQLPIVNPYLERNIVHMAWEQHIPVFEVSRLAAPETISAFSEMRPDVACVACFPQRIPASLLALPRLGFLNLHPSLLPHYRGPTPLFWSLRDGSTGVTIHFMDQDLDSGNIAAQAPVELPDGVSGMEADRLLSALGGQLMVEVVCSLARGTLTSCQQPDGGSYYPSPSPDDFKVDATWSARRAFNFMRGTGEWGYPYIVEIGGERLALKSAVSYAANQTLLRAFIRSGNEVWIQFTPGVLRAQLIAESMHMVLE